MPEEVEKPTVGRIVHYFDFVGAPPEAAIVIDDNSGNAVGDSKALSLSVFTRHGTIRPEFFVLYKGEVYSGRHWDWPQRK